jgi:hypothetical protein
MTKLPSMS